jgi:Protein of unknown function (DUF3892)
MTISVQVSCITKRHGHLDPHERIEGLGGVFDGKPWYLPENEIIAELEELDETRRWDFYTSVGGKTVWVVVAVHEARKYLKTTTDGYEPNNLLNLPECP